MGDDYNYDDSAYDIGGYPDDSAYDIGDPNYGDPYANWGGGQGGDGTNGSADSGGGFNWGNILGGKGGEALSALMKGLGLGGSQAGSLIPLLSLLAGGGALYNQNRATGQASQQIQDAANKSNDQANALIGGARDAYKPYMEAGTAAIPQLQAMVGNSNLADKFGPPGVTSDLASKFKGAIPLSHLARR